MSTEHIINNLRNVPSLSLYKFNTFPLLQSPGESLINKKGIKLHILTISYFFNSNDSATTTTFFMQSMKLEAMPLGDVSANATPQKIRHNKR